MSGNEVTIPGRIGTRDVSTPQKIAKAMGKESQTDRECGWVLHLDTQLKLIERELVAMGSKLEFVSSPREIFRKAVINSTHAIVFAHTHPCDASRPSRSDTSCMKQLREAGKILGIELIDFIIIAANGKYYSYRENARL